MNLERWFFEKLQTWVDAHRPPVGRPVQGVDAVAAGTGVALGSVAPEGTAAPLQAPSGALVDGPVACGWFDSTHELQRGLQVLEHDAAEGLVRELPLRDWLLLHLSAGVAQATQHRAGQGVLPGWSVQVGPGEGPVAA